MGSRLEAVTSREAAGTRQEVADTSRVVVNKADITTVIKHKATNLGAVDTSRGVAEVAVSTGMMARFDKEADSATSKVQVAEVVTVITATIC